MFDSFSNTIGAFNFNELFEGNIIEAYENNTCLVYIPKFFLNSNEETQKLKGNYLIDNSKILNHIEGRKTLSATNGILCKPVYFNSFSRKVKEGENVLVFFFNGDPQKPYYIDAHLGKKLMNMNKDIIFEDCTKQMGIYSENNEDESKIIIKVKNKEYIFSDKNGNNQSIVGGSGGGSVIGSEGSGGTGGTEGSGFDGYIPYDISNKYLLQKEWNNISSERLELEELAIYYKIPTLFEIYDEKFIELKDYIEPLIENIETITTIDYEQHTRLFTNYYKAYNSILKDILKRRSSDPFSEDTTLGPVDEEVIESVVKDLIYKVNSVASGQFIKEIIEDNIFSSEEKVLISRELVKINEEKRVMDTFAPMYYTDENEIAKKHEEYNFAYDDLREYLDPMLAKLDEDTEIDGEEFYNKFDTLFKIRVDLMKDIQTESLIVYEDIEKSLLKIAEDSMIDLNEKALLKSKFDYFGKEKLLLISLSEIYSVSYSVLNNIYDSLDNLLHMRKVGYLVNMEELSDIQSKTDYDKAITYYINERNKQLERIISSSESFILMFMEGTNIGSANLILNSNFKFELNKWSFPEIDEGLDVNNIYEDDIYEHYLHTNAPNIMGTLSMDIYKARKDDDMVLSMWVRAEEDMAFTVEIVDSKLEPVTIPYMSKIVPSSDFNRIIVPIKIIQDLDKSDLTQRPSILFKPVGYLPNSLNSGIIFDFTQSKLEFGNVPTAWSPAREDYDDQLDFVIADIHSSITQTVDQIKMEISSFEATINSFKEQSSSLVIELDNITAKIESVEGKTEHIEQVLGDTTISQTITEFYEQIAQLKIELGSIMATLEEEYVKTTVYEETVGDLESLYVKITEFEHTIVNWGATLEELGGKIEHTEGKIVEFEQIQNELLEITGEHGWIKEAFVTLQATLDGFEISVNNKLEEWENTVIKDLVDNTVTKEEFESFHQDFTGILAELGNIKILVNDIDAVTKRLTRELEGVYTTIEEVKTISEKYAQIETTLEGISLQYRNLESVTSELSSQINEINGQSQEALNKAAEALREIDDKAAETLEAAKSFTTANIESINRTLESHQSAIDILEDNIELKVWQQDIDSTVAKLEFGGRNLIRWSGDPEKFSKYPAYSFLDKNTVTVGSSVLVPEKDADNMYIVLNSKAGSTNAVFRLSNILIKSGETYHFSAYMCLSPHMDPADCKLKLYACDDIELSLNIEKSGILQDSGLQPLVWRKVKCSFKVPNDLSDDKRHFDFDLGSHNTKDLAYYMFRPKLEYGTVATAWTPAPEDVEEIVGDVLLYTQGEVSTLKAAIQVNADSIENSVESLNQKIDNIVVELGDQKIDELVEQITKIETDLTIGLEGIQGTVNELEQTTNETIEMLGEKADITTTDRIEQNLAELVVKSEEIKAGLTNVEQDIDMVINGTLMNGINNFSLTNNLDNWTLNKYLYDVERGSIIYGLVDDLSQSHALYVSLSKGKLTLKTNKIPINPKKDYRMDFNIMYPSQVLSITGTSYVNNADATINLQVTTYNQNGSVLNVYKDNNTSTSYSSLKLFEAGPTTRYDLWTRITTYIYSTITELNFENIVDENGGNPFIIKGDGQCVAKIQNNNVAFLSITIELSNNSSDTTLILNQAKLYLGNPKLYEIDAMSSEQYKLLQDAYIQITPGKIKERIFSSDQYVKDMGERYTKTELETEITKEGGHINEWLSSTFTTNEYAEQSLVKIADFDRTTEYWKAAFKTSGAGNLLKNTIFRNGLTHWSNNGGSATEIGIAWGNPFYGNIPECISYFPNGITYASTVQLKPNTDYVYQAQIYVDDASGLSYGDRAPMHWWSWGTNQSQTASNNYITVQDYDQTLTSGKFKLCYCHFKTHDVTFGIVFKPFIYLPVSSGQRKFSVTQICLKEGVEPGPWLPHESELYEGITKIDENGIQVSHSNIKTKTRMTADGFYFVDENDDMFASLSSKDTWACLRVQEVFANNIENTYTGNGSLYVDHSKTTAGDGSSSSPFNSFGVLKEYLESMPIINKDLTIYVQNPNAEINEALSLANLKGTGWIKIIYDKACVHRSSLYAISLNGINKLVIIEGGRSSYDTSDGAVILDNGNQHGISITDCKDVYVHSININCKNWGIKVDRSRLRARNIDFGKTWCAFELNENSMGYDGDSCGDCGDFVRAKTGSIFTYGSNGGGICPYGNKVEASGKILLVGNARTQRGSYKYPSSTPTPPPATPTTATYTQTFKATSFKTYQYAWSNWGDGQAGGAIQGAYGGYGNKAGHAFFDLSAIRSFLGSGTVGSCTITLTRRNGGGVSGATNIYVNASSVTGASGTPSYSYNSKLGTLSWGQTATFNLSSNIVNALKSSAGSIAFYSSSDTGAYAEIVSCSITLKVTK